MAHSFASSLESADLNFNVYLFPDSNTCDGESDRLERDRRSLLDEYRKETKNAWLIGTSSLLMGIDVSNIKHVVFLDGFYSLNDVLQGSGRASRSNVGIGKVTIMATTRFLEEARLLHSCLRKTIEGNCDLDPSICLLDDDVVKCSYCKMQSISNEPPGIYNGSSSLALSFDANPFYPVDSIARTVSFIADYIGKRIFFQRIHLAI